MKIFLGQNESPAITPDPYASVAAIWDEIKAYCQTKMTPAQCDALLGYKPIYQPPTCVEKPKVPFWVYLGVGYILGKHL